MSSMTGRGVLVACVALLGASIVGSAEAASLKAVAITQAASPVVGTTYEKFAKRGPAVGGNTGERVTFEGLAKGSSTVKGIFADDPDDGGSLLAEKLGLTPDSARFRTFKRQFTNPAIDSSGTITLASKLRSGLGEGVYARKAGDSGLTPIVRTGDVATGLASGFLKRFTDVEPIGLIATTAVAFLADISDEPNVGGLNIDQVIYTCAGGDLNCTSGTGTLTPTVTLGDAVDDRPGEEICDLSNLASSEFGVAFRARIGALCPGGTEGVFRKAFGGTVETLALVGEAAEFPNSSYTQFRRAVDIANDGTVAFRARTQSTTAIGTKTTIFLCDPTTCPASPAEAAVSVGDTLPSGNFIRHMETPRTVLSDAKDVAFFARSIGPAGGQKGVYIRRSSGTIEKIAEKGDPAPKLNPADPDAVFRSFRKTVAMSDDGRVAFLAKIKRNTGSKKNRQGIFVFE